MTATVTIRITDDDGTTSYWAADNLTIRREKLPIPGWGAQHAASYLSTTLAIEGDNIHEVEFPGVDIGATDQAVESFARLAQLKAELESQLQHERKLNREAKELIVKVREALGKHDCECE